MTELDKFKRRTIRSVARLLYQEKKAPEELWAQMKKETGTDCRVLWERMRALCVKKLNRMIAVDDRSASLPSIARLSLTDWLLVDLVLVHENIDVLMMEKPESKEFPALIELFSLVQRFDIEGKQGSQLAEAWAAATVFYNRQGRQCSPMLLQRRWHQLKKLTRARFYKFWHAYRGNVRLLPEARKAMPTRLQMAIAKRYPKVITGEFPDWEQLIENNLIIMPDEFEAKMRLPNLPKPCNSNDPDLVLVEPVIETIELAGDSDTEEHNEDHLDDFSDPEKSNDATEVTDSTNEEPMKNNEASEIIVKTEPVEEDGLSNVQVSSATHVPEVEIPDENLEEEKNPEIVPPTQENRMVYSPDMFEDDVIEIPSDITTVNDTERNEIVEAVKDTQEEINLTKSVKGIIPSDDDDDVIEIPSIVPTVTVDLQLSTDNNTVVETAEVPPRKNSASSDVVALNDSDEFDDIIKIKADEFCCKTIEVPVAKEVPSVIDDLIKDKVETFLKKPTENVSFIDEKPVKSTIKLTNSLVEPTAVDLMADMNFVDDGIEFVDDGVEFVEEDDTQKIDFTESTEKVSSDGQSNEDIGENTTFDLKLLMDPVVYTTKLDQMQIFRNKQYNAVNNIEDMEMAVIESKPVSKKTLNINVKQESAPSITDDTGDNDDLFTNNEGTDEEDNDDEMEIVSPNSYMLKKPRTRSYDPIKLCKNPDFNTKLKRLTIGFLSSSRNRHLLNACIPMTIDLSKAFESKLVNNTLYLKSSGTATNIVRQEVIDKQASSIVPSAMPVQSLIDNSRGDIQNLISNQPLEPIINERQKIIKLPDIDKVRRINQQLLTAQVPPLRVFSGNNHQPKSRVVPAIPNELEINKDSVAPVIPSLVSNSVANNESNNISATQNTFPTVVKVKSEENAELKGVMESEETIPPKTLPPAKEKLIKIINQAKISTQEALVKIDDGTKPDDFPRPIVVKDIKPKIPQEVPKRTCRTPRISLAWAPRFGNAPKNLDDFLLTRDTLEKMLHLLMNGAKDGKGCKCCQIKSKKCQAKKGRKPKAASETEQIEADDSELAKALKKVETAQKEEAPPKASPTGTINIDDSPPPPPKATTKKKVIARGRVVSYCCWANQKLSNRKRITKHMCLPEECICCCRDKLAAKLIEDEERIKRDTNPAIEITSYDEVSLRKACESIENVVQQSREISNDQDKAPAVVRTVSTNTPLNTASISNVSPRKFSVDLSVGPMLPLVGPINPPTPPKAPRVITKVVVPPEDIVMMAQRRLDPRFKQPQLTKPLQVARCSCQKPALSQDSQRYIVIDGSRNCPFHPVPIVPKQNKVHPVPITPKQDKVHPVPITPKQDKVLYLHSKSIAKSPSESPIFLGKNKILLTTVKFPRDGEEVAPASVALQSPKIIPTLPLPAGVQLVLMPSGNVTYTLDPGVELDETQLAHLPTIIAAVQEQLNSSAHAPAPIVDPQVGPTGADLQTIVDPSQPIINSGTNLLQPGVNSVTEIAADAQSESNLTTSDNIISETVPPISLATNEVFQDADLPSKITNTEDMEVDATDSKNIDAATHKVTSDNQKNTTVVEDKVSNVTVNMDPTKDTDVPVEPVVSNQTPIVDETRVQYEIQTQDTASIVENSEAIKKPDDKEEVNNKKNLLSDLMEMSGISAEDATVPEPMALDPPSVEATQTATNVVINTDHSRNLPELSPVTSFAELKYACEQNGKFFKLDFETGVIVPINVCIKKNPNKKLVPLETKEFIDLTDEVENKDTQKLEQTTEASVKPGASLLKKPNEYIYNGKAVSVSSIVKPVKLFRAFRPSPTLLKLPKRIEPIESSFVNRLTHIEKRKQILNKVETRIDLVESDEPMEEEYLLDSSDDSDSDSNSQELIIESLDLSALKGSDDSSDDSSDDEPLAKKFKRLKESEADKEENIERTNIYDEITDVPQVPDPSVLTQSVIKDLNAIDTPLHSHDELKPTSQLIDDPASSVTVSKDIVPSLNVRTDVVPSLNVRTDVVPSLNVRTDVIPSLNVRTDVVPSLNVRTDVVPSLNVRTDVVPSLNVTTDMVPSSNVRTETVPTLNMRTTSLNVRTDLVPRRVSSPDFNEESDDDEMPVLRFMSDESDRSNEDGDDCILGV